LDFMSDLDTFYTQIISGFFAYLRGDIRIITEGASPERSG
jgi:hypothetical protein